MDIYQCIQNISLCLNFYNVTLCSFENNTFCVEDHAYCVSNDKIKPTCLCLPCFTGEHCEEEEISQNLWSIFTPISDLGPNGDLSVPVILILHGVFLSLNGILSLQTYLCKKIRDTNLGIYLIMLSIVSIFMGLMLLILVPLNLHINALPQPQLFTDLQCLLYSKFVNVPLVYMYNGFIASIAIERMLVECVRNYSLHDSRRRSIIASVIIITICALSTLPGVFTVRANQPTELRSVQCINFTSLGYILDTTIRSINLFAFCLIYIVMNTVVLGHLLRHRRRFVDSDPLLAQLCLILRKHKDFFIPYSVQALCLLPAILMDFVMTCSTAQTIRVARLSLAFLVLQNLPFIITFYLYIYLSPVYWSEFTNSSPIGKCLTKGKIKLQPVYNIFIIENNHILETRF